MKNEKQNLLKEHYQRLRRLGCEELWSQEVPRFNQATAAERRSQVSVVRAVGVVFSETGTPQQKETARQWLIGLLEDPEEKIRRYAMAALPKLGAGEREEAGLLSLLPKTASGREEKFLAQTLGKIGGKATLETSSSGRFGALQETVQKLQANVARMESPSTVRFDRTLADFGELRINLRCRSGLEGFVRAELAEAQERGRTAPRFRITQSVRGLVVVSPTGAFRLSDVYALRCFSTASLVLGTLPGKAGAAINVEALAALITSPLARRVFETFTAGPVRYRLEFLSRPQPTRVVRALTERVYRLDPGLLNDPRNAPWEINIYHGSHGCSVELTPKLRPDPRFAYRQGDVPAASHPPLAACLAQLAGAEPDAVIWDPFCGSGLELIERCLRGGVRALFATDRSAGAIETTKANITAARLRAIRTTFAPVELRDFASVPGLGAGSVSLIITNPPMGRRVPIPDLPQLIEALFATAAKALKPGGRLVFVNPLPVEPRGPGLKREFRQKVDLGGFHAFVEKYVKPPGRKAPMDEEEPPVRPRRNQPPWKQRGGGAR